MAVPFGADDDTKVCSPFFCLCFVCFGGLRSVLTLILLFSHWNVPVVVCVLDMDFGQCLC